MQILRFAQDDNGARPPAPSSSSKGAAAPLGTPASGEREACLAPTAEAGKCPACGLLMQRLGWDRSLGCAQDDSGAHPHTPGGRGVLRRYGEVGADPAGTLSVARRRTMQILRCAQNDIGAHPPAPSSSFKGAAAPRGLRLGARAGEGEACLAPTARLGLIQRGRFRRRDGARCGCFASNGGRWRLVQRERFQWRDGAGCRFFAALRMTMVPTHPPSGHVKVPGYGMEGAAAPLGTPAYGLVALRRARHAPPLRRWVVAEPAGTRSTARRCPRAQHAAPLRCWY
jgi:hypothetical protein